MLHSSNVIKSVISSLNKIETKKIILDPVMFAKGGAKLIKNKGRMLVRKSGTEPKIRIMGESEDNKLLAKCINIVKRSIK